MHCKISPFSLFVLLVLHFAWAIAESDPCDTGTTMSSHLQAIKEGGQQVVKSFSSKEAVDRETVGMGYLSWLQIGMEAGQAIPIFGSAALGIFNMMRPETAKNELKCMVQEFNKIHKKLDEIERAIKDLSEKLTNIIEVQNLYQDYNEIGIHTLTIIDAFSEFLLDPVLSRVEALNASCKDHDPFAYGLNRIKALITHNHRLGKPFLHGIIEATSDNLLAYFDVSRLIMSNVKELTFFDAFCEAFVHPYSDNAASIAMEKKTNSTLKWIARGMENGEYYRQTYLLNNLIEKNFSRLNKYNRPLRTDAKLELKYCEVQEKDYKTDSKYREETTPKKICEGDWSTLQKIENPSKLLKVLIAFLDNELNLMLWDEVVDTGPNDRKHLNLRDSKVKLMSIVYQNKAFQQACTNVGRTCETENKTATVNGHELFVKYYKPTNLTDAMSLLPFYHKKG